MTGRNDRRLIRYLAGWMALAVLLSACAPVMRGRYTWGHEVNTIRFCGAREIYWVRSDQELAARLRTFVQNHTAKPYTPVYIEATGYLLDEKPDGFAADYDGIFHVKDVALMKAAIPVSCPAPLEKQLIGEPVSAGSSP